MPTVTLSTSKPTTASADVLVLGIRSTEDRGELAPLLELLGFTGDKGQSVRFPSGGLTKAPVVVALALPDEPTAEDLRRAAAKGLRAATNATSIAFALHPAGSTRSRRSPRASRWARTPTTRTRRRRRTTRRSPSSRAPSS
ncbi:M17 family peptidase N-terminal domain-containing protein [Aeromicrobium sp. UC242_57]|uniref:M17 family peptidase N-terminal domain-containing protein n=1 Tax=Aeromicrobium sp. UC242_57 TaxID=3374624 RepID=UPI00378B815A